MADASTIAGSGLVALAVAAAPKIFELARTWLTRRADVQIAEVKADAERADREASQRIETLTVGERVLRDRADEHRETRQEVAALRIELGAAREAIDDCQRKHATSEAHARVLQDQIADQRDVIGWMRHQIERLTAQVERLSRDSVYPPAGEPAE